MSKITESARGEDCTIRIPGTCNFNPETVVLCHDSGGGMGAKVPDYQAAYGCSACHDVVDGRAKAIWNGRELHRIDIRLYFVDGIFETQAKLVEKGLLRV